MNQNHSAAKFETDDFNFGSPPLPALVAGFVQCVLKYHYWVAAHSFTRRESMG